MAPPPVVGTVEPAARGKSRGSRPYWLDRLGRDAAAGDINAACLLGQIAEGSISVNAAVHAMRYRERPCPSAKLEREWSEMTPEQRRAVRRFVQRADR